MTLLLLLLACTRTSADLPACDALDGLDRAAHELTAAERMAILAADPMAADPLPLKPDPAGLDLRATGIRELGRTHRPSMRTCAAEVDTLTGRRTVVWSFLAFSPTWTGPLAGFLGLPEEQERPPYLATCDARRDPTAPTCGRVFVADAVWAAAWPDLLRPPEAP